MMSGRRSEPSLSEVRFDNSFRKTDGIDETISRDFDFFEPNMPAANDDEIYLRGYGQHSPSIASTNSNFFFKILVLLILLIIFSLATVFLSDIFLDNGITPISIMVGMVPIVIVSILSIILFRLNRISQLIEAKSNSVPHDHHLLSIYSKIEELRDNVLDFKQSSLLHQNLISKNFKAIEINFENSLVAKIERLSDLIFNVNSTTCATAKLIDNRLEEVVILLKEASNHNLVDNEVMTQQVKIANHVNEIENQLKTLTTKISQKFYDTGSIKDEFEKLMNGYLDQINKRSDLVVIQLDQAVSRSQDLLEKTKVNRLVADIASEQKKREDDVSAIERRLNEAITKIEEVVKDKGVQSNELFRELSYSPTEYKRFSASSDYQAVAKSPSKLTTQVMLNALEKNDVENNLSIKFSSQEIEKNVVQNISSGENITHEIDDNISSAETTMNKQSNKFYVKHKGTRNIQKSTFRRSGSLLRKIFPF